MEIGRRIFTGDLYSFFMYHNRGQRGKTEHQKQGLKHIYISVLDDSVRLGGRCVVLKFTFAFCVSLTGESFHAVQT